MDTTAKQLTVSILAFIYLLVGSYAIGSVAAKWEKEICLKDEKSWSCRVPPPMALLLPIWPLALAWDAGAESRK